MANNIDAELLYKNVCLSIDRLNEMRKSSNENTFDSTIRYLIHEIETIKLTYQIQKDRKPYPKKIVYVFNADREIIDVGNTDFIMKKYSISTISLYRRFKKCCIYEDKYYFSRDKEPTFIQKREKKQKPKKKEKIYEVYDILNIKMFEGTMKQICEKYNLKKGSVVSSMMRKNILFQKFIIKTTDKYTTI